MIYCTSVGELRFTIQECTLVVHRTIRGGIVMGKFHLIHYVNLGAPDIAYSLEKAEKYLSMGVRALQFDLPSRNPCRETPLIREKMAYAYAKYGDYAYFLEALTSFRSRHPDFEMQMVSYEDVVMTIGTTAYIDFCRKNAVKTCRISGDGVIELARKDFNRAGIDTLTFIDYDMKQKDIDLARQTDRRVMLRNVREGMEPREGMRSWKERISYLRANGIQAPIYATAGITCGADLIEAKEAGANGAFVGNCLMKLWEDEPQMERLLLDLEAAANS